MKFLSHYVSGYLGNYLRGITLRSMEEMTAEQLRSPIDDSALKKLPVSVQHMIAEAVLDVVKTEGAAAAPIAVAFAKAAAQLTDDEYNSRECLSKPLQAMKDSWVAQKAPSSGGGKGNPFREAMASTSPATSPA